MSPAATRLTWAMVRLDEESSPFQPVGSQQKQSLTTSQKRIKKAYHTHSSFLAKYHKNGIVAMLDVSDVDKVDACLKGTKREILRAMHVKELIQSNHSERYNHIFNVSGLLVK